MRKFFSYPLLQELLYIQCCTVTEQFECCSGGYIAHSEVYSSGLSLAKAYYSADNISEIFSYSIAYSSCTVYTVPRSIGRHFQKNCCANLSPHPVNPLISLYITPLENIFTFLKKSSIIRLTTKMSYSIVLV